MSRFPARMRVEGVKRPTFLDTGQATSGPRPGRDTCFSAGVAPPARVDFAAAIRASFEVDPPVCARGDTEMVAVALRPGLGGHARRAPLHGKKPSPDSGFRTPDLDSRTYWTSRVPTFVNLFRGSVTPSECS